MQNFFRLQSDWLYSLMDNGLTEDEAVFVLAQLLQYKLLGEVPELSEDVSPKVRVVVERVLKAFR